MPERKARKNILLLSGNEACCLGALAAGAKFFGGYPITPSSEIAEMMSRELPEAGGKFIQMEDEIASIGAVIGASLAGLKSLTATSGPGFSLMQENLGYAVMTEVPCVIIDVQRGGPSTGLPTKASQSDMMQARWGTHGDHPIIALVPSSVLESYYLTIRAFNLAEKYRTPVVVLIDEIIGHMREKVEIPEKPDTEIIDRKKPTVAPADYLPHDDRESDIPPMANFGEGYRFNITGLTHDPAGFPTSRLDEITALFARLRRKIEDNREDIIEVEETQTADAEIVIFAYGSVARSAKAVIRIARDRGHKVGMLRPMTIWPFPQQAVTEMMKRVKHVIVPEMNEGQIYEELFKYRNGRPEIHSLTRTDSELITPMQILDMLSEIQETR
jgi:2-oxoglutarate ferredoxin oxidoreductase subunit alpha